MGVKFPIGTIRVKTISQIKKNHGTAKNKNRYLAKEDKSIFPRSSTTTKSIEQ